MCSRLVGRLDEDHLKVTSNVMSRIIAVIGMRECGVALLEFCGLPAMGGGSASEVVTRCQ